MAMDVATFAKQLKDDGINAAKIEADKIIQEAKHKSDTYRQEAEAAAKRMKEQAGIEISQMKARADAELRLVARDLLLGVKKEIERIAALLLKESVGKALATDEVVKNAVAELVKNQKSGTEWELALGPTIGKNLAETIVNDLFKKENASVKLVAGLKQAGLELKSVKESRVLEVTEESVTQAFRQLLSSELARYLDSASAKN